jgi:hypothetical protein
LEDSSASIVWTAMDEFRLVRYSHVAARTAFQLLADNSDLRPLIQAQFQMNAGFEKVGDDSPYSSAADRVIEIAQELVNTDFQSPRKASLISYCSALEHLAKCFFVEWAELMPNRVRGLDTVRISLQASDFLDSELRDRLFLVADKIYQEASAGKGYFDKLRNIVNTYVPDEIEGLDSKIGKVNKDDFNEAFLVRNCLIHHGATVNRQLSRCAGFELGMPIGITKQMIGRYFAAIEGMASGLFACAATTL